LNGLPKDNYITQKELESATKYLAEKFNFTKQDEYQLELDMDKARDLLE